jgi:hypothetical protein
MGLSLNINASPEYARRAPDTSLNDSVRKLWISGMPITRILRYQLKKPWAQWPMQSGKARYVTWH